jgi:small subunit ribosomal protein S4
MARYTGPKSKIARKFREPIFGPDKALEKKNYPPGKHGISNTRDGARQLVSHRHITVNGSVVSVPSYSVKVGDVIEVREKSKSMEVITDSVTRNKRSFPWITWDARSMKGTLIAVPQRADIPENIREQLIVELYSR